MSDPSRDTDAIAEFYARGSSATDSLCGAGRASSPRELRCFLSATFLRHLPWSQTSAAVPVDTRWLAERGYRVHPSRIPYRFISSRRAPCDARPNSTFVSAEVGDARAVPLPDAGADAVLLLGPLYHLPERDDRLKALSEACRVCRPGGVVLAAVISRFASMLDGLRGGYLEDPAFAAVAASDVRDGRHRNPTGDPNFFTTAFFHRPEELTERSTRRANARDDAASRACWFLPDLTLASR